MLLVEQLVCTLTYLGRRGMWLARHKPPPPMQHPPHLRLLLPSSFPRFLFTTALRLLSSASAATVCRSNLPPQQPPAAHFMVDYLVSSCGLSRNEAARASRRLVHLKSPDKPDAVLHLLKREGLCVPQIRRAVLNYPRLLVADPSKTLEPKIRALRGGGLAGSELTQLISTYPRVLVLRDVLPRIEFWRDLLGSMQNFLRAASKNLRMLDLGLDDKVIPKLSLLSSVGFPSDKIGAMILRHPRLVGINIDRIEVVAEEVKSMGFTPGTGMFAQALSIMLTRTRSSVDAKFKFLGSLGWSQADIMCSVRRLPGIVSLSEKKIRAVMDFLLKEAGCSLLYIACHSVLLAYSLEKRLMPRCYVLRFLRMKGVRGGDDDLFSATALSEKKFLDKYIVPNSTKFPKILEIYRAVCAKTIPNC